MKDNESASSSPSVPTPPPPSGFIQAAGRRIAKQMAEIEDEMRAAPSPLESASPTTNLGKVGSNLGVTGPLTSNTIQAGGPWDHRVGVDETPSKQPSDEANSRNNNDLAVSTGLPGGRTETDAKGDSDEEVMAKLRLMSGHLGAMLNCHQLALVMDKLSAAESRALELEIARQGANAERDEALRELASSESRVATLEKEREALEHRVEVFRGETLDWENREAAICPEDVGFEEYIAMLRKHLRAAVDSQASLQKDIEHLPRYRCALDADDAAEMFLEDPKRSGHGDYGWIRREAVLALLENLESAPRKSAVESPEPLPEQ